MKFQPKTERELAESRMIPEGEYPFEISKGEDKISKSGNEMIELLVRVYKPDGQFLLVNDYLLASMEYKLRHAAEACGLLHEYESGVLIGENFVGKTGTAKVKIQKDKNGQYPDKNVIADYIVPKDGAAKPALPKSGLDKVIDNDLEEDSIPF